MRTGKKLSLLLVIAFLVNILLTGMVAFAAESNNEESVPNQACGCINDSQALPQPEFQPGVQELIEGTFLQRADEFPDPNESVEVLRSYMNLLNSANELSGFEELIKSYPESRHAHKGLATAYYNQYLKDNDLSYLGLALDEAIKASKVGFSYGRVLYIPWIKKIALEADRIDNAGEWFEEILKVEPGNYSVNYHYAKLLQEIKEERAEKYFLKAIEVCPTGNFDANVGYVEFLLDNGRYQEALDNSILEGERAFYLDFLHGYALEKLGQGEKAVDYYEKYEEMSETFPVADKYKITDSPHQNNITFEQDFVTPQAASAQVNLSWATACEAGGESIGGMRMVAWSVRQRVNRGTIPNCLYVKNQGSTLDEKYSNVICQPGPQYEGVLYNGDVTKCDNYNTRTPTTNQVANDVYNGIVPDPYTGYCPDGSDYKGDRCGVTGTCTSPNRTSYYNRTPHSFLSYPHTPADPCMKSAGAVCGDGGTDNYFDYSD